MGFENEASSSSRNLKNLPTEGTPLLPRNSPLSSQPKTFANILIAIVGSGVLGLPYTFMKTGWLEGIIMLFSVAILTYYCMLLLIRTRRKLESEGFSKMSSFGDLGFTVCGHVGKVAVDTMIVLSQVGFCVGYLMFIGNSLTSVFNSSYTKLWGFKPKSLYIWGVFPFQLGLNSIRLLTHLAPLSIFADVIDVGAMGVVMVEDLVIFFKVKPVLEAFSGLSMIFYGLGVAVYAFEGIGMVLPLESEAAEKEKFGRTLGFSMGFISLVYALFGVLGYFAFGDQTNDIITTNFGKSLLTDSVQIALCVNLFFTFPLMMNPVHEVVERRFCGGRFCLWLRWAMVLGTTLVALFVPNFADFLSLVGSSVCCALGFVLPALFHLLVFKNELGWKGLVLDAGILVLGLVFGVSGTISSVAEMFNVKG